MTTVDTFIRAAAVVEAVDPASAIMPGTVLEGCYEVRERLGTGGMATVYRAYDRRLEREVAIKVPRLGRGPRARVLAMFEREARATARLSHPNIVELHHIGHHRGTPFAVIALLHGETLAARLARRGALAPDEALAILDGVLQALAHAHERGIVHRDLKPQNVFLTADDRVKLLDFGVAIEHGRALGTATRAAGTPGYMAPEHAEEPDPRNDLWAAGVLFLECVTGRRGERGGATPGGAAPGGAAPALELPAELPRGVRAAIARAIDPEPDRRPSTAGELRLLLASSLAPQPGRAGTRAAR
ncbi:MAG TPA: serine/threonine-protein kinase, partial [Kofleriaceae bacterium]|nr:serine/threonine-protein kinase [Kofleriaceae bacterium]